MNYLKRNESIKHIDEERSLTGLASIDLPHKKYFPKGALVIDYPQIKMYDYLYSKRKNHLDYIALNYLGHRLSFRKLFKNIEITAKAFKSHKIKNGDYIVIILPTIPEAVYIFLALNRIGAIPIFLDSKSNSKDILQAITSSQAKIVIMEKTSVMPEILNNSLSSQMPQIILVSPTLSLPYGQNLEGEICYQTPCMMKGYAFNYQEDNNFYYHQWCHSGDLGKMDKDGGIYITGRIMRQIMHNGNLFSPREVEEYVRQNVPFIEECVLIGKPDEIEENIPILFYVLKEKYRESALIIRNALIKICYFLNDYQIPREFIELESLPLTPKLKIDYRFLEEMVKETPKTLKKTL